jgi:hypothetical protein
MFCIMKSIIPHMFTQAQDNIKPEAEAKIKSTMEFSLSLSNLHQHIDTHILPLGVLTKLISILRYQIGR